MGKPTQLFEPGTKLTMGQKMPGSQILETPAFLILQHLEHPLDSDQGGYAVAEFHHGRWVLESAMFVDYDAMHQMANMGLRSQDSSYFLEQWKQFAGGMFRCGAHGQRGQSCYVTYDGWKELLFTGEHRHSQIESPESFSDLLERFLDARRAYQEVFEWRTVRMDHDEEIQISDDYESAKRDLDERVHAIEMKIDRE